MLLSLWARRLLAACLALTALPPLPPAAPNAASTAAPGVLRGARVESMPVPISLQLPLILKILVYDRNLASRAQGELRVAIVVAPGQAGTTEIAAAFQALADRTVKGMRLRTVTLEYESEAQLDSALRTGQVRVLYVAPGNADHLDALVRLARAQRIITTTGVPAYVPQGIAVGIGVQQDRPHILINLAASRAGGSEFDASLLRIVKIVR